jgi:hypothetical protein
MRLILFAAALCLMVSPVQAVTNSPVCVSKDEEIAKLQQGQSIVQAKKLTGDEAKAFVRVTGAPFPETYSYVITWIDEKKYDIALVSVFDEHNCLATRAKLPKAMVKDFIGAES